MFIIKNSRAGVYLFTGAQFFIHDKNRWTHDIAKAHVFGFKEDADFSRDYLRDLGWTVETVLTFGVQRELKND